MLAVVAKLAFFRLKIRFKRFLEMTAFLERPEIIQLHLITPGADGVQKSRQAMNGFGIG